jgi:outer membrane protein
MKNFIFSFALLLLCSYTGFGQQTVQKLGHMNANNLLVELPEAILADSTLVLYRNGLIKQGDTLVAAFKVEYEAFVGAYNAGTLSALQTQKRKEDLERKQQVLQAYESDVQQKVGVLREQLLAPIVKKLNDAIVSVAKENGYTFIFDTGAGNSLFAAESDDITPMVRKRLGLK